jgi:hypothetical protein
MATAPWRISRRFTLALFVAICALTASGPRWSFAQEPVKQERVLLDLHKPLDQLTRLSLFGPSVEAIARTSDRGLDFTVPAGRANTGNLGVEWQGRLRGDFDVSVGYELIAVGEPLPQYGAGVSLRIWYEGPVTLSTVLTRSKRPEGERMVAQQTRKEGEVKEQYLNTRFIPATGPRGRLRMARAGSRVRFLAAEAGDYREIQALEIGSDDVHRVQLICTTHYTPIALEACFTDLDIRADRILPSWIEPEPRPGRPTLSFDLRTPLERSSRLSLFGPTDVATVATDARGLHITLPAGRENTNPVGLELARRLTGDFDVSLGYELLAIGGPLQQYGVALDLKAWFDTPTPLCALLVRTRRPYGDRFITLRVRKGADGKEEYLDGEEVPATRLDGRLRLLRTGSRVHYLASEGGEYRKLRSLEIGTADVRLVQAQATTIWAPTLLEARFTDFKVQADQIEEVASPPDVEPPPAGGEAEAVRPPAGGEEEAVRPSSVTMYLLAAAGILVVPVMAVGGLYAWSRRRVRRSARSGGEAGTTGAERVVVRCPHCQKRLSILTAKMGKDVKCPACAADFAAR